MVRRNVGTTYTLTYDTENRLNSVTQGSQTTTLAYDADGQRVMRETMTDTIVYVGSHYEALIEEQDIPEDLDGDCLITVIDIMLVAARWGMTEADPEWDPRYDLDGDGEITVADIMLVAAHWRETCERPTETVKYYTLGGRRVAMRKGEELYYLFSDHLGSTSVVYDTTDGTWVTQRYAPYGSVRSSGANALPTDYTFTGQRVEAGIDLLDYRARFYNPALGRFVSADTIVPNPGSPQDLNRYTYAANNPLRYTDPDGHRVMPPQGFRIDISGWGKWAVRALRGALFVLGAQTSVEEGILKVEPSMNIPYGADFIIAPAAAVVSSQLANMADDIGAQFADDDAGRMVAKAAGYLDEAADAARTLVKVGTDSAEGAQLIKKLAVASTRNERIRGGITILGSFPEYIDLAKLEGMTYFDMPKEVWETLSNAGDDFVWAVNKQFLDDSIAAGHSFVVTLGENKSIGKYLQREIKYLIEEKGYRWVNGVLVKPN